MKTKLSVVTINYNNREGLRKTLESVAAQTTRDFEYIVIDGGSTDGSVEVIKEYEDIIDYWVSEPDRGIYHAMNKGVAQAHGDFVQFLNSGDYFFSDRVIKNFNESSKNSDVITGIQYQIWIDKKSGKEKKYKVLPPEEITLELMFCKGLLHQSCFIKTSLLKHNPYDETLKIVSDWKFFVQELLINGRSYDSWKEEIVGYDNTGISATQGELLILERERVLRELFPERIFLGITSLIKGRTFLEKVIKTSKPKGFTIKMLTFHARIFYGIIHTGNCIKSKILKFIKDIQRH